MRFGFTMAALGLVLAAGSPVIPARPASAQEVNCANEFRSAKLYFAQKLTRKAVDHFAVAVKACPDKAEYRARYAMALGQLGEEKLKVVEATGDVAGNQADVDSVRAMYKLAGSEFDESLKADGSKQNVKFVAENRKHFWVARYNEGIKLAEEEKYDAAAVEFELSRLIDSKDVKAYKQGAIALSNQGKKGDAAALLREALTVAPGDTSLVTLINRLGADEARDLMKQAEDSSIPPEKALELATRADSLYTIALKEHDKDANLYFDRGLARLTSGAATKDSLASMKIYEDAASDFHKKAKELIPAATDSSFYQSALYNEIQASMNANNVEKAQDMIREYLGYDCKDAGMWKTYAQALYLMKKDKGPLALIISNSMTKGSEVPIADATKNAQEDEAAKVSQNGKPDHVYAYTEEMGGKTVSISTWLWCVKRKANVFYLGKDNGEVTW